MLKKSKTLQTKKYERNGWEVVKGDRKKHCMVNIVRLNRQKLCRLILSKKENWDQRYTMMVHTQTKREKKAIG